jgi:hypothetical protein
LDEGIDAVALEQAIAEQGRRGSKQLYKAVLQALDAKTAATGGAKQRLEARWVATTFGRVRIWRYRIKGAEGSFHPLDRTLGLSQAEASAALRETVRDLATRIPYRQAAEITSRLTGDPISHQGTWRILQAEGTRVRAEERARSLSLRAGPTTARHDAYRRAGGGGGRRNLRRRSA